MKLLQRILSRGLLISLAVLAAIGYHFRADLFSDRFGTPAAKQQVAVEVEPVPPAVPAPAPADDVPASEPSTTAQSEIEVPQEEAIATDSDSAPPAVEIAESANNADATDVPPVLEANTESANNSADATHAPTADEVAGLNAARQAYWARDLDAAERLYQEVAATQTSNPDALGELGNLYYAHGRWRDAAQAYAGAIERLIAAGDRLRAQHLLMVLDGLDAARAQELRTAL